MIMKQYRVLLSGYTKTAKGQVRVRRIRDRIANLSYAFSLLNLGKTL